MESFSRLTKILIVFSFVLFLTSKVYSQSIGVGAYLGGGVASGNSTNIGSFNSSFYVDIFTPLSDYIVPRISVIYTRDFNYFLPNAKADYYPFLKSFSLKAVTWQSLSNNMFIEEGVGPIMINDRTFSTTNVWTYGVVFSISAGFDLRVLNEGFKVGIGTEYANTFNDTLAKYFSLNLQGEYFF